MLELGYNKLGNEEDRVKKEFKVSLNPAVLYFEVFYVLYIVWMIIDGKYNEAIVSGAVAVVVFGYLLLIRPYKYTIDRKVITINQRLGKSKEVNLMTCETICDPILKMTKIVTNPRAIEIYTDKKKRFVFSPKDRMGFVQSVVVANKRIHVQVNDYAKQHKAFEKQQRKERKKEMKQESKA